MKKYILLVFSLILLLTTKSFSQFTGPENQLTCLGGTAEFAVQHSFDYVAFIWEESIDNNTFTSLADGGAYSGTETAILTVNTTVLNPSESGIWRYYRCRLYSNVYGWSYSDAAYLEINLPPVIDFTWDNPCEGQTVHFESSVISSASPFKYHWTFENLPEAISVYPNPSYQFTSAGIYNVVLTVTDVKGCETSITKEIEIFSIPELTITGKEVVCSNELKVKYAVDLEGENVHYNWDVSGFGTIDDNTQQEISIDWNAAEEPIQTSIMLTVTIDPSGCSTQVSQDVLITSYVAPPEGTVFRKPNGSSLLIYHGPEVNSYRWGYTDKNDLDHYIAAEDGGERLYCDFDVLDPLNEYWVETSYDSRINCVTRSYFDFNSSKILKDNDPGAFTIFPVPASGSITVSFEESTKPSGIYIYNLMMQKVFEMPALSSSRNEYRINVEGLESGVYIMSVVSDPGVNHYRLFTIEQ